MQSGTAEQQRLEATALAAARRGWKVFPLQPGGMAPAVRNWHERATTDLDRIRHCWRTGPFNIGVLPCRSGLLVIELAVPGPKQAAPPDWRMPGVVDGCDVLAVLADRHRGRYPATTYAAKTPQGHWHLYFAHPRRDCPTATRGLSGPLGWLVGLKTTGCYVAAAGSVTAQGSITVVHDAAPEPLPDWLLHLLPPAEAGQRCGHRGRIRDAGVTR
ncbi:bifunctional DNA primase/polymerase [Streptomyces olivoreticuli]